MLFSCSPLFIADNGWGSFCSGSGDKFALKVCILFEIPFLFADCETGLVNQLSSYGCFEFVLPEGVFDSRMLFIPFQPSVHSLR